MNTVKDQPLLWVPLTTENIQIANDIERICFRYPWSLEELRRYVKQIGNHGTVVFCQMPGKHKTPICEPLGFFLYHRVDLGTAREPLPHATCLETLAVRPQFRQMGIGTRMLEYVTQYAKARNCDRLITWVSGLNKPANAFIGKRLYFHMHEPGHFQRPDGTPDDGLLYELFL